MIGEILGLCDPSTGEVHHARILQSEHVVYTAENVDKILVDMVDLKTIKKLVTKAPVFIYIPPGFNMSAIWEFDSAATYYEIWRRLKEVHLPVVEEMFIASSKVVVMPDLTSEGGTFYDRQVVSTILASTRTPQPTDAVFLGLDRGSIQDAAISVLDQATRLSIGLSIDDPLSLLVNPNCTFQPYALDIGLTIFDTSKALAINGICFDRFMRHIDKARNVL